MSRMAWVRWPGLGRAWALARAVRMVTVKEIRSGSVPAVRAASARRALSAW